MLNIILIIIIVISLGVILYLVLRKFSKLALIDTKNAPIQQQIEVKRKIIEERLKRNIFENIKKGFKFTKPLINKFIVWGKGIFSKIVELEEEYRYRVLNLGLKDKIFKDQSINKLLTEAESLKKEEKYSLAEKKYIEILKVDTFSLEAYKGLTDLYCQTKDYEHAKETLEYALKLGENDDFLFSQMAKISSAQGDLKQAEDSYLKSIELNNQNANYYYDLGNIYLQLDDFPKALEMAKKTVELEPNNPKNLDFLLEVSLIVKDKVLAKEVWEKLKIANPENKKLDDFKERIEKI